MTFCVSFYNFQHFFEQISSNSNRQVQNGSLQGIYCIVYVKNSILKGPAGAFFLTSVVLAEVLTN